MFEKLSQMLEMMIKTKSGIERRRAVLQVLKDSQEKFKNQTRIWQLYQLLQNETSDNQMIPPMLDIFRFEVQTTVEKVTHADGLWI